MSDPKTDKPETDQPEMDVYSGVRWSALSKYGAQGMAKPHMTGPTAD